ncbi:hypothetical protein SKAU_G00022030 [Synaphobranchus kaupii]|uniref:Uncharacterized protein n=1 Tax=Synaphobranchus kaupii TaxID=118154 RepID=A0A9Q1GC28_SYNKA|nr:hypothetical protein SKAU_G00022030 [Synaphobranchus kaupii]
MDSIEKAIQTVLPQLDEAKLETLVNELVKLGVEGQDDLQFIQEDDIKHLLTPIQCRKILHSLNGGPVNPQLSPSSPEPLPVASSSTCPISPTSPISAWVDSFEVPWNKPEDYPDGETSASLEKKKLEMLDIFSREGLKGAERGRAEDLMAITYAKQREYINANPSPSILDVGETILTAKRWMLSIEGRVVIPPAAHLADFTADFTTALATLFACYYVFNVEYQVEACTTLEFVQRFLVRINPDSVKCSAKEQMSRKTGRVVKRKTSYMNPHVISFIRDFTEFAWLTD